MTDNIRPVPGKPGAWIVPDPAESTGARCALCGADYSASWLVYEAGGGLRCVAGDVCRLRAELRDTKGTAARSLTNAASVLDAKDAELRDVTAERDALRARASLPVIATCGDCLYHGRLWGTDEPLCGHPANDGRPLEDASAPPGWCPLRKAAAVMLPCVECSDPVARGSDWCRRHTAERDVLDRVRTNADAITPALLSHYEHALDEADASQPGRAVPSTQRASALRRAQVYRDLLVAIGHESACSVARGERLARLEAEAGR